MNNRTNRALHYLGTLAFLVSSVGCAGLPWRSKKTAQTMPANQYANQAAQNITYDNPNDFNQDYQPSYSPPPPLGSSGSCSDGSGSCCSN